MEKEGGATAERKPSSKWAVLYGPGGGEKRTSPVRSAVIAALSGSSFSVPSAERDWAHGSSEDSPLIFFLLMLLPV